jgi:hypothetical protein
MNELDRLAWAEDLTLISYGVRIGIRVNKRGILESVLPLLPPSWKPAAPGGVDRLYSIIARKKNAAVASQPSAMVYADDLCLARTRDLAPSLDAFESDLQLYVAEMSPRRVFVHAGVVAVNGKAIVIPGRSFSGKTTLTAELVKAGATYYSDEYAVLDRQGRVHHYARPLAIRENGQLAKPTKYNVEALGGRCGNKPLPVGLIIVSKYEAGAQWRPRQLSAGEGALALLANTVSARREPATMLATLRKIALHTAVFKSKRGDARQVVEFILDRLF